MREPARRPRLLSRALLGVVVLALATGGVVLGLTWLLPQRTANACTVTAEDGSTATVDADQADNAALITAVALRRELPARAASIAIATAVQESKLRNIDYGDRDSLGLFQQRPSQGWGTPEQVMDPVYATNAFYDGLVAVQGYEALPITEAAQQVQRSAYPDAYADHEPEGRAFASALSGHSPAALTCRLPMPEDEATVAEAVAGRLERDFGVAPSATTDEGVEIDAASFPGSSAETLDRYTWAAAQWSVATASVTGVTRVHVGDQVWDRSHGNDAQWTHAEAALAPGTVRVS
ncbi:hypothetical protein [Georgenia faecalis]|uniref:hypothetical protein n=1 Tax=Georgenia faecalis TaxID=2483799 RepID=UPI000FDB7522|nr:hypothetical protein [Georgenia faecalis]